MFRSTTRSSTRSFSLAAGALVLVLTFGAEPASALALTAGSAHSVAVSESADPEDGAADPAATPSPGEDDPTEDESTDPGTVEDPAPEPMPEEGPDDEGPADPDSGPTDPVEGDSAEPDADAEEDAGVAPHAAITELYPATPAVVPSATRISGSDRYDTAARVSRAAYPSGAAVVVVASGNELQESVVAAGVAAAIEAPLLPVAATSIPSVIVTELERLQPQTIVIVGSTSSVSAQVEAALGQRASSIERIDGAGFSALSHAALVRFATPSETVYLAGGSGLLGGPLATAAASAHDAGVLLVDPGASSATASTIDALQQVGAQNVVAVGGRGSLSTAYLGSLEAAGFDVVRISGADRYGITENIARTYPSSTTRAIFTSDTATITVPTATMLAAVTGQPLYFATEQCIPDSTAALLSQKRDTPLVLTPTSALSNDVAAGRSCATVQRLREAELRAAIVQTLDRYPGSSFTVSVREVGGMRQVAHVAGSTRREPASMIKVFAAWAAFERIESGRVSMNWRMPSGTTLIDCLKVMIYISDNYCHTDIVHWIGISTLNREIRSLGLHNTYYGWMPEGVSVLYGANRTSANDLSALLYKLEAGTLLGERFSAVLLRFMKNQPYTSRIPEGIPPGIEQSSKPGALWVTAGLIQNDSAIVRGPESTFVLTMLGTGGSSKAAIRAVARTVYSHFNGSFGAAASHPDLHVRTKASTPMLNSASGTRIGTIPGGTALEVVSSKRRMYEVRYNGRLVWIFHTRVTGL